MMDEDELRRLAAQVEVRPGDPVARARLALALLPSPEGEALVRDALMRTRTCLELGLHEPAGEALALLRQGVHGPEVALELALLEADVTLQKADVGRARALLEAVLAEHPDAVGARLRAAALALGLGEAEAARRLIEPVANAGVEPRALYVQALLALKLVDEAAQEAETGIEQAPEVSLMYQLLGIAELTRGRVESATLALSEGLRLAPEDPVAYYNLALAFEASGSHPAALGVTDAGLELAPTDARLLALRARLGGGPG